ENLPGPSACSETGGTPKRLRLSTGSAKMIAMPTPSNDEFIANLDATIPDAAKAVVMAAENVERFSGETGDTAVLRAFANLQFFITQVDLDIRMNLRLLLADDAARITAEKYLALALIE